MNLKLHLPNRTIPVEALIQNSRLTITSAGGIWFQIEGLTADYLRYGDEPGIIREAREPREFTAGLTLDDLDPALPVATLKAMLIDHFTLVGLHDIAEAVMDDYKAATGKGYKSGNGTDPQLAQDLARIEPIKDKLLDGDELVWGAQSRIAEVLGIVNGGSHRQRILAVAEALLHKEAA